MKRKSVAYKGNRTKKRKLRRQRFKRIPEYEDDEDFYNPFCSPIFFLDFENKVDDSPPPLNFKYITNHSWHPSYPRPVYSPNSGNTPCNCQIIERTAKSCEDCTCKRDDLADGYIDSKRPFHIESFKVLPTTIVECNKFCGCDPNTCKNRLIQKKRHHRIKLVVCKFKGKGWGIRARQKIERGSFICEYVGEVISEQEADKRGKEYDKSKLSYLWTQGGDLHLPGGTIDATHFGNIARFANHSCTPNCFAVEVLVECRQSSHCPRIAFFAGSDIEYDDEITIDYSYALDTDEDGAIECKCGTENCRGRIR